MKQQWPLDVSVSFDPYYGEPSRDGDQGAEVLPDGKVHFRIIAPKAGSVEINQFGTVFPLVSDGSGVWEGTVIDDYDTPLGTNPLITLLRMLVEFLRGLGVEI